jgi:hypothetical protein
MPRSVAVGAAAVVLAAGAAVAGTAAQQSPSAPPPAPPAQAPGTDAALAAMVTADEDTVPRSVPATRTPPRRTLCARVPAAITRTEALQKRLAADAGTQGSVAWLQAKVDAAEKAGRTEAVPALRNRLAFRTELAQLLPHRLEFLQTAQRTVCAPGAPAPKTS